MTHETTARADGVVMDSRQGLLPLVSTGGACSPTYPHSRKNSACQQVLPAIAGTQLLQPDTTQGVGADASPTTTPGLTPVRAIRRYCLGSCSSGSRSAARDCSDMKCPLWPYRMGRNPARAGTAANRSREITGQLTGELLSARADSENVQDEGVTP